MKTIGIVMAVRDQAKFVPEAIASIFDQTLAADQIVFVDDGSSDGSGELAAELGAEVIRTQGVGTGPARRLGAAALKTDFIGVLDGDDRFTPLHNEALLAAVGDGDAAAGMTREFYDPGRESELAGQFDIAPEPTAGAVGGSTLITRAAYERAGGFTDDPDVHDFIEFIQRLGKVCTIASTGEVVLERRVHGENYTIVNRERLRADYLKAARAAILARRGEGT